MKELIVYALLSCYALSPSLQAKPTDELVPPAEHCSNALDACIDLQKNLTNEVDLLKQETIALESRIDREEDSPLPWWVYVIGGVLAGYGAAKTLTH